MAKKSQPESADNGEAPSQDGLLDFISGTFVADTPEEREAVQPFARRLVDDFGYPKALIATHPQCRIRRSPSDEARSYPIDIAVFTDRRQRLDDLFMIVECKQSRRSDGVSQLKTYMDLCPAILGVWFNGDEHVYLQKFVSAKGVNEYREIPALPLFGQRLEDIGLFHRRDLRVTLNLRTVFKLIRNYIAGNTPGITRDETIATEIINVLFCKISDELNTAPAEILKFRHGIRESQEAVAARVRDLFNHVKSEYSDVFAASDQINLDAKTLAYVVGELQPYAITEAQRDIIGEAFEVFIGPTLKGSQGQFFTPRNLVRTAIHIVDPGPDEKVLDPACGSGGFLIVALEHIWAKLQADAQQRGLAKAWLTKRENAVAEKNFRGIEKDFFLTKITKAYMAIIGDGRGGIFCDNALLSAAEWTSRAATEVVDGTVDVILTNPPFGAKITVSDPQLLRQFDLGHQWKRASDGSWRKTSKLLKKQPPQILFIERCWRFLKPGGRMAVILPDGILGGAKVGFVAHFIKQHFDLLASIDCPIETFSPNTTTKVHLLVLAKKVLAKKDKKHVSKVFMSVPEIIGHDRKGHAIYVDGDPTRIRDDLEVTQSRWSDFVKGKVRESTLGFTLRSEEIEENLNVRRYLPEYMHILRRVKASAWPKAPLASLAQRLSTGANVDNLDYTEDRRHGVPYILVKNIQDEGISFSNLKYVKKDVAAANQRSIVQAGDILINRTGDAGIAAIVPKDLEGALLCGFCFLLRVKTGVDPYYVAAFLNSELGRKQLKRLAIGSVLEHITKADLGAVVVLTPPDKSHAKLVAQAFRQATEFRIKAREQLVEIDTFFSNNSA